MQNNKTKQPSLFHSADQANQLISGDKKSHQGSLSHVLDKLLRNSNLGVRYFGCDVLLSCCSSRCCLSGSFGAKGNHQWLPSFRYTQLSAGRRFVLVIFGFVRAAVFVL